MSENAGFPQRRTLVAAAALGLVAGAAQAKGESPGAAGWRPALDARDNWLDLPSVHRMVFDAVTPEGAGNAIVNADTYFKYTQSGYGMPSTSLAAVLVLRHFATVYGFNDAIWAKYGSIFSDRFKIVDPQTHKAPSRNPRLADSLTGPGNAGISLAGLAARGARFAVCGAATERLVALIAGAAKAQPEMIKSELAASLIPNSHLVAAGIVTLGRAQERGYAVSNAG